MDRTVKIGVVGICGAGKTTLAEGLKKHGIPVRQIAQEHSYVPEMWQIISNPDVLIFLEVAYPITLKRKNFHWSREEYQQQADRLRHAYQHADLRIDTDELTPDEVLKRVLAFLGSVVSDK
jgi:thymidylate kinase